MKRRLFRHCGHVPGALTPEGRAVVDQFRAMLAALRDPQPWTPGHAQDLAVRIGLFVERAHTRPGDNHGPEMIDVALVHPDTPHAAGVPSRPSARPHRTRLAALRDDRDPRRLAPGYAMLTHAAANPPLPDDIGMAPARYGVHVEAHRTDGTSYTLLRLGPYTQTWGPATLTASTPGWKAAGRLHPWMLPGGLSACTCSCLLGSPPSRRAAVSGHPGVPGMTVWVAHEGFVQAINTGELICMPLPPCP